MISIDEYAKYDGLGLAELVAKKEVKPQELADTALAAVERINPKLNAVLQRLPDVGKFGTNYLKANGMLLVRDNS